MTLNSVLAVGFALIAALCFAVAAVLQERGTEGISDEEARGAGFLYTLAHRKVWVAGIIVDILGFATQAAALVFGSLLLVQPLLVTSLLFALPLAAWTHRRGLTIQEWAWSLLLTASLVVFMILGTPSAGITKPSLGAWIIPLAIMVPVVLLCVFVGFRMPHGTTRSLLLALAAGITLGVSAPFTKTGIDAFSGGFVAGISAWEFWAMAITATLGTLWQQSSYQAGDVQSSLPAVTVLKPIIAVMLGLTIYQETLRVGHIGDAVVIASLAVMCIATVMLGRLSAIDDPQFATAAKAATAAES